MTLFDQSITIWRVAGKNKFNETLYTESSPYIIMGRVEKKVVYRGSDNEREETSASIIYTNSTIKEGDYFHLGETSEESPLDVDSYEIRDLEVIRGVGGFVLFKGMS